MYPVQGKSPLVQVKKPYDNLCMVTSRLSSYNPECTKYICRYAAAREGVTQYIEKEKEKEKYNKSIIIYVSASSCIFGYSGCRLHG